MSDPCATQEASSSSGTSPCLRSTIAQLPYRDWLKAPTASNFPDDQPWWTGEEIAERLREPWSGESKVSLVYSFDRGLDGFYRLAVVLDTWKSMQESARPKLIVVAGGDYAGKETLNPTVKACETGLQTKLIKDTEDRYVHEGAHLVILRGAPLQVEDGKSGEPCPTRQHLAKGAAVRLQEDLGSNRFVFHNNTSSVLFSSLAKETVENCSVYSNSGTLVLGPDRWIVGANIGYDLQSYHRAAQLCEQSNVPITHCHGSLMGFDIFSLSDLPDWDKVLTLPSADATKARDDIRFTMGNHLLWSARMLASLKNKGGNVPLDDIVDLIKSKAKEAGLDLSAPLPSWLVKPVNKDSYGIHACTFEANSIRLHTFRKDTNCPLSNTLGHFAAACLDSPSPPEGLKLLPVSLDWKDRSPTLTLLKEHAHYFVTGDRQEDMISRYKAVRERLLEQATARKEDEPIIDTHLAKDWMAFRHIASAIAEAALETLDDATQLVLSDEEKGMTRQAYIGALESLQHGAMTRTATATTEAAEE